MLRREVYFVASIILAAPEASRKGNAKFDMAVNPNDGFIRLSCERLSNSIWPTFGRVLAKRNNQEIEALTQLVCRNTSSKFREEDDPLKWFESFSGLNIRWEAIGILFTYWSFGALSSMEDDSIFVSASGNRKERREMMIELKECATSCIAFCSHIDHGNPLLVYLLYKHSLLESMISGDASEFPPSLGMILKSFRCFIQAYNRKGHLYWRQHGDLCSMTTCLGMHRDTDQTPRMVSVSSEMRRRIYAAVFNIDKVISTFTGRPPMLNHRYSSTPLPLDLSDEQLLSDTTSLSKSIERLDANGWNTDGQIYSTTILRARTSFSVIRGGVLDIALRSSTDGVEFRIS